MTDPIPLWRIEIRVPKAAVPPFEDLFGETCIAVASFGDDAGPWRVEGYAGGEPDARALTERLGERARALGIEAPAASIERLAPRDWLADNRADFPPRRYGRYYVFGSHESAPPPPGSIPIRLDAGPAFGSGEHPTTAACLRLIGDLAKARRYRRPLDMGSGSGILAIAMAKAWRRPVIASDIDPVAVAVTRRNARLNGVHALVGTVAGSGFTAPRVRRGAPFDLITANILARPLTEMAGDLARALEPGGVAVLSGLISRDGRWVLAAMRAHGLRLRRRVEIDGWLTLVIER